jgi:hypothetical protein
MCAIVTRGLDRANPPVARTSGIGVLLSATSMARQGEGDKESLGVPSQAGLQKTHLETSLPVSDLKSCSPSLTDPKPNSDL